MILGVDGVIRGQLELASDFFPPQPSKLRLRAAKSELAELDWNRTLSGCFAAGFTKGGGPSSAFGDLHIGARPPPFLSSTSNGRSSEPAELGPERPL